MSRSSIQRKQRLNRIMTECVSEGNCTFTNSRTPDPVARLELSLARETHSARNEEQFSSALRVRRGKAGGQAWQTPSPTSTPGLTRLVRETGWHAWEKTTRPVIFCIYRTTQRPNPCVIVSAGSHLDAMIVMFRSRTCQFEQHVGGAESPQDPEF